MMGSSNCILPQAGLTIGWGERELLSLSLVILLFVCVCVFYGMHVEIRGQFLGIQSFLLPLGHGIKLRP